nr:class I SAM-dependent methyltransferase [uncultured Cohaesibacter sp.]
MFEQLKALAQRPAPFCHYTATELWTRPHIAKSMLAFHLDGAHDIASRKTTAITSTVNWLHDRFDLEGKKVCDLGCGPGLYAQRLAQIGAIVTGVDISATSIAHARNQALASLPQSGEVPSYLLADYLEDPLPEGQDLILLIYADYCALSPVQRARLIHRMKRQLRPGGAIYFDVFSDRFFATLTESTVIENDLMGGFWAPSPYVGLKRSWLWPDDQLALDHYLIVSKEEQFEIYNWLQYYSPALLEAELIDLGFGQIECVDILTGGALGKEYGDAFGVILQP